MRACARPLAFGCRGVIRVPSAGCTLARPLSMEEEKNGREEKKGGENDGFDVLV